MLGDHRDHPTIGADAHGGYLAEAHGAQPSLPLVRVEVGGRLPFRNEAFSSATLLDVLEHVGDETTTLSELRRVLRPGALLLVSVPARHRWSWLDPDDLKFRFPALHRVVMGRRYRGEEYHRRFRDPTDGLVGDIAAGRHRHDNYDAVELIEKLAGAGFGPISRSGANLLGRPAEAVRLLIGGLPQRLVGRLIRLDGRFRSAHLFVAFERDGGAALA